MTIPFTQVGPVSGEGRARPAAALSGTPAREREQPLNFPLGERVPHFPKQPERPRAYVGNHEAAIAASGMEQLDADRRAYLDAAIAAEDAARGRPRIPVICACGAPISRENQTGACRACKKAIRATFEVPRNSNTLRTRCVNGHLIERFTCGRPRKCPGCFPPRYCACGRALSIKAKGNECHPCWVTKPRGGKQRICLKCQGNLPKKGTSKLCRPCWSLSVANPTSPLRKWRAQLASERKAAALDATAFDRDWQDALRIHRAVQREEKRQQQLNEGRT